MKEIVLKNRSSAFGKKISIEQEGLRFPGGAPDSASGAKASQAKTAKMVKKSTHADHVSEAISIIKAMGLSCERDYEVGGFEFDLGMRSLDLLIDIEKGGESTKEKTAEAEYQHYHVVYIQPPDIAAKVQIAVESRLNERIGEKSWRPVAGQKGLFEAWMPVTGLNRSLVNLQKGKLFSARLTMQLPAPTSRDGSALFGIGDSVGIYSAKCAGLTFWVEPLFDPEAEVPHRGKPC